MTAYIALTHISSTDVGQRKICLPNAKIFRNWYEITDIEGQLPGAFAIPAGWGDIVIATSALVLLVAWSQVGRQRSALLLWNALGLLDILFVVADAAKQALADPASIAALLRLPLSLLVTFLVPLIIGSHLLVFARLRIRQ